MSSQADEPKILHNYAAILYFLAILFGSSSLPRKKKIIFPRFDNSPSSYSVSGPIPKNVISINYELWNCTEIKSERPHISLHGFLYCSLIL